MKTIAMVIATRGNSQTLEKTITESLRGAVLPTTTVVLGLDEDDPALEDALKIAASFRTRGTVKVVVGPRPDSIGAVYNRCAEQERADIYIAGADDLTMRTHGWDERILHVTQKMPDFIGVVGCGTMPVASALPGTYAVTRPLIDRMGFFLQPYTPFWWMDTWLFEIAVMIGRLVPLKLNLDFGDQWMKTRGMRDLSYWAAFFDDMRSHRRATAEHIVNDPEFKTASDLKKTLLDRMDSLCQAFLHSNSCLRDPAYAARIMETFAHSAPEDERYVRIKERSMELLQATRRDRDRSCT
jgi:hypothetical protein